MRSRRGIGTVVLAVPVTLLLVAAPATAAVAPEDVVNTETIQARLDATGEVTEARVYEQIAITGDGEVTIANPVSTEGLRNLDGFGGVTVSDGVMVSTVDVQGEARLRTVSDYTSELPLTVEVRYLLNGEEVEPGDVVGASGDLEVLYQVTNSTATTQTISFDDGTGGTVEEEVEVVIPMVGSLSTTLPSNFTDVTSAQANMAGDGRGGTKMSFTMTLFPPIGSDTAEFGYLAKITDGVVPPASISALPVRPLQSPSFAAGAEAYAGGADTGARLTDGAVQIDSNLLKLRDGASGLLAGLVQLSDGAEQLRAGLQGEAAPGADTLAAGAAEAADGADDLLNGSGRLRAGAGELASGSTTLDNGADQLASGALALDQKLSAYQAGLSRLHTGVSALPQNADYQLLLDGIGGLIAAIGASDQPGTVRFGLASLSSGVTNRLQPGVQSLITGVTLLQDEIDAAASTQVATLKGYASTAKTRAFTVAFGQGCLTAVGAPGPAAGTPPCPDLIAAVTAAGTLETALDSPAIPVALPDGGLKQQLEAASAALDDRAPETLGPDDPGGVLYGLNSIRVGIDGHAPGTYGPTDAGGLQYGLDAMIRGTDDHLPGTHSTTDPGGLLFGLHAVDAGVQQLVDTVVGNVLGSLGTPSSDPLTTLRGGAAALNEGAGRLAVGGERLAAGTEKLESGAGQLADGTVQLDEGAGKLADGNRRIADGAGELAAGLAEAGEGSAKLADGLVQAEDGAPQIVDGATQLSEEGTSQLVLAGQDTAQEFGAKYALIAAVNDRAAEEGMAFGAPEGARGNTAYSLELAGMNGEPTRNLGRMLGALGVFGLGAGLIAAVRGRFI